MSASVECIGDRTYLVTCELACHSQLTGCAVYLNSSRTGAVGTDWDELSTIPVNAQRDMALLGISRPMAVWNVTLYGSCVESMGVQAVQSGKVMGQVKSIIVVYHTATGLYILITMITAIYINKNKFAKLNYMHTVASVYINEWFCVNLSV